MNYKEAVRKGKALVAQEGDIKWQLGDLALEVAPMGERVGPHNGSTEKLAQYAEDIDVPFNTLQVRRQVAAAWAVDNRLSTTSWKVHQILMAHQDLIKPKMTTTEASDALGHKNIARKPVGDPTGVVPEIKQATPEQRKKILRDLVEDPEINDEITGARLDKLEDRVAAEGEHTTGRRLDPDTLKPTPGDEKLLRYEKALSNAVNATSVLREMSHDHELLVVGERYAAEWRKRIRWALQGLMDADEQLESIEEAVTTRAAS